MNEVILCKYGEMALKGLNKGYFEDLLLRDLRRRLALCGKFEITTAQSTVYILPADDSCDLNAAWETCRKVFGISSLCRAAAVEKNMDAITEAARTYIPPLMAGAASYKAEAKRSDKRFPFNSPQIAAEVGGAVGDAMPGLRVDVKNPDITVMTEIREQAAYIHAGSTRGAGGMPVGSNGRALLLLSGGIDSPVAGLMLAKRGVYLDAVHFESYPYTSVRAREKVFELAEIMAEYAGRIRIHVVSLTHLQEELRRSCEGDYFTLLLRRSMMRLAGRVAQRVHASALVTGESLGQVASQTMAAIGVTDPMANIPVFRPCIGLDKEEIVTYARRLGTYETSILPYEDCCTVFTPKHPKTRPEPEKVEAEEKKLPYAALEDEAFEGMTVHVCDPYGDA